MIFEHFEVKSGMERKTRYEKPNLVLLVRERALVHLLQLLDRAQVSGPAESIPILSLTQPKSHPIPAVHQRAVDLLAGGGGGGGVRQGVGVLGAEVAPGNWRFTVIQKEAYRKLTSAYTVLQAIAN